MNYFVVVIVDVDYFVVVVVDEEEKHHLQHHLDFVSKTNRKKYLLCTLLKLGHNLFTKLRVSDVNRLNDPNSSSNFCIVVFCAIRNRNEDI